MQLKYCDLSQTISDFAKRNSKTGYITFYLYGNHATNYINSMLKVPYVRMRGVIKWGVPLEEITINNVLDTFNIERNEWYDFGFEEVKNNPVYSCDLRLETKTFIKFLKKSSKTWKPKKVNVRTRSLATLIVRSGVEPRFVLDAIWTADSYKINEFCTLFSVSKSDAKRILKSVGYKITNDLNYFTIVPQEVKSIKICLLKSKGSCRELGELSNTYISFKNSIYRKIVQTGEKISDYGKTKEINTNPTSIWDEPAYGRRKDYFSSIMAFLLTSLIVIGSVILVVMFVTQFKNNKGIYSDSFYSFWGAIVGAFLAGVVTIITTFFIIQRSYKIDYHQERLANMPYFEIDCLLNHFSIHKRNAIPKELRDLIDEMVGNTSQYQDNLVLIKIENIGNGPAFNIRIEGLTLYYEEPTFQSIIVGKYQYVVAQSDYSSECDVYYYDIYGNYYVQHFSFEERPSSVQVFTVPPELVLRTNRIRYIQ